MYLCNHHMAIKRPFALRLRRAVHMRADLGHHWRAECDVGHKVTVHDVDVQPVGALGDFGRAFDAEGCEVCTEDRGGDYCRGRHCAVVLLLCVDGQ